MPPKDDTRQPCIRCPQFVNPEDPKGRNCHATFEECQREFPAAGPGDVPVSGLWWGFTSNEALSTRADLKNVDVCKQLLAQAQNPPPSSRLSRHMSKEDVEKYEHDSKKAKGIAKFSKTLITKENLERAVKVAYPVKQTAGTSASSTVERKEGTGSFDRTTETLDKLALKDDGDISGDQTTAAIRPGGGSNTVHTTSEQWSTIEAKTRSPLGGAPVSGTTSASKAPATPSATSVFTAPAVEYQDPPQRNSEAIEAEDEDAKKAAKICGEAANFNALTSLEKVNSYAATIARHNLQANGDDTDDETALNREIARVKDLHGLRKDFAGGNGQKAFLVTNSVRITPPEQIFVYQVFMKCTRDGNTVKITKFADKKSLMNLISNRIPQLGPNGKEPMHWVTDGDLIWSTRNLFSESIPAPESTVLILPNEEYPQPLTYRMQCGDPVQAQSVEIKFKEHIANPDVLQLCEIDSSKSYRQSTLSILVRGLNAFLTNSARDTHGLVFTGGQKGFELDSQKKLDPHTTGTGDPLRCLSGFSLSSRPGNDRILLNINTAFSAFFNIGQTVHDFLRYMDYRNRTLAQKTALLNGLHVTLHPNEDHQTRHWFIYGIAGQSAGAVLNIKVSKEHTRESQKALPQHLFRADKLNIQDWQPFPSPLTARQTDKMIDIARKRPHENADLILHHGLELFYLDSSNQVEKLHRPFGMSVGTEMLEIPAYRLHPVRIQYRNVKPITPPEASWNLFDNPKFAKPGQKLDSLPYINCTDMSDGVLLDKLKSLREKLEKHDVLSPSGTGQPFWTPRDPKFRPRQLAIGNHRHDEEFEILVGNVLQYVESSPETPILVIIDQKDYDFYASIKRVAELWEGRRTICLTKNKLNPRYDNQPLNPQTASNIALKYNIKIGGTNHELESGLQPLTASTGDANTIVIGADVTHPGPGAHSGTPSIAAVVGSVDDDFMQFPGSMRLQRSRKEFIVELGDMVKERLIDWAEQHGWKLPEQMLFYRDGVSESQYDKIRTFEIPQLQQAYNWARRYIAFRGRKDFEEDAIIADDNLDNSGWPKPCGKDEAGNDLFQDDTAPAKNFRFRLTYVVVGKRHNTRFYPIGDKNMISTTWDKNKSTWKVNGNIKPGFVIDQVITHPYSFDFYLQSHKPLAGTGKSAHYFVLQNSMGLDTAALQNVTHAFCYAYSRSTTGVSYCAPAYYADRLCDRGRAYLRHWLTKSGEDAGYKPHRDRDTREANEAYSDAMKDSMRNSLYWRPYLEFDPKPVRYGCVRRNPWEENLDEIMFYL